MKHSFIKLFAVAAVVFVSACKDKSHDEHDHHHDASDAVEVNGNQALYDEVMKIHDEVMPKIEDIHNREQALKEKLKAATEEQKKNIEDQIARLDSADDSMMEWMHQFNPMPDSLGEEKAREYLESEMEKIRKVKERINNALEETKE